MANNEVNEIFVILDALRRNRRAFVITLFCGFILTMLPVMLLPSIYESSATILIESQEIPSEFVRSTVTGFVEERLKAITQITLSRSNLMGIIERLNLYEKERKTQPAEEIIETMRKDIAMTPIQADVQSATGRPSVATIAFTLSYKGKSPPKVLQTTNTLVSLFLEENYRSREEKASTAQDFLEKQLESIGKEVSSTEAAIAQFKESHLTSLPEMLQLNMEIMERIRREISVLKESLSSLADRKAYLEGQLATVEPLRPTVGPDGKLVLSPNEELKMLRNKYLSMQSTLSDKHPDVIKIRQQISALEQATGAGPSNSKIDEYQKAITNMEARLQSLRSKYSGSHPDVIATEKELASTKKLLRAEERKGSAVRNIPKAQNPDNPAWVTLNAQLKSTELEIAAQRANLEGQESRYNEYLKRVEEAPKVEQEYRRLQRDYATSQAKYQETLQKLMSAREAKGLEEQRVGEKLTLVDPPILPETPTSPKRLLILALGVFLSGGLGAGVVALREMTDGSVHGRYGLRGTSDLPLLTALPYLKTDQEIARQKKQRRLLLAFALLSVACLLLVFHFLVMPLDVLFYSIQTRISARL